MCLTLFYVQEEEETSTCTLRVTKLSTSDFGSWSCRAMYWGDWAAPATLSLSRFEDASLLFQTYYGDVIAEAGRWIYYFFMFNVSPSFTKCLF